MEVKNFDRVDLEFKSGEAEGVFRARVVTWDVPDRIGDITRKGAFAGTLQRWRESAAPIPVVFSHNWNDPQAFIGEADPQDAQETATGLEIKGRLFLDEPNGRKVFRELQRRTIKEWSYGYVVEASKALAKGARELLKLDLIEFGPTLAGVGVTQTLATKSHEDVRAALAAHKRALVAEQLDPYRGKLDRVRRQLALERAARA